MFKNSKINQVVISGLLLGLFIPIILTFYLFVTNKENESLKTMNLIAESTKVSAIESLWYFSKEWADIVVDSAIKNPKIDEAVIVDNAKNVISQAKDKNKNKQIKVLSYKLEKNGDLLGTLYLTFNITEVNKEVFIKQNQLLVILITQAFASSFIIFFIIKFKILDPLKILTKQSKLLSNKKLNKEFKWEQDDEIGEFGKSLENTRLSLKEMFTKLEEKVLFDNLTQTYNRYGFDEIFQKELKRSNRNKLPISLIMFDIDYFKKINDTYGHQIGDEVLIQLTSKISKEIRQSDYLIRWGGEEFIILSPDIKRDEAIKMAEKIRISIEKEKFSEIEQVTISMSVVEKKEEETTDELLKRLDDLLYNAKNKGRNQVVY